jgi:hypothetical protein
MREKKVYELEVNNLIKYEITANQFLLLNIIANSDEVEYISYIDVGRKDVLKDDLFTLYQKDYISNAGITNYTFKFSELAITDKGLKVLGGKDILSKRKEDFNKFVEEYYNKFPEKVITGNLLVKSNLEKCKVKMIAFIKKYKYSYEVILEATDNYIKVCKSQGYTYMKTAYYFIDKMGESILASYCEQVTNKTTNNISQESLFKEL